jgi:tRNA-specific 2-thiouridylase
MRALVAMSGGVDSSVAAALLVEEGHEVIGVTLKLWQGPNGEAPTAGCCTVSDSEDARRVAAQLDIPYYVLDYTDDFSEGVVDRFLADYVSGRTPNPCIECNRTVKFDRLVDQMRDFECDVLVTGHYARTELSDGRWRLLRGVDRTKDQSYVLSMLTQTQLGQVRFPVGGIDKSETRRIAARLSLRTANKPESQDICFVGSGDYRAFIRSQAPEVERPGPIVDETGEVVGEHRGIVDVTIGQRRGLNIAVGEPRYVTDIVPATNTVVIGRREELARTDVGLRDVTSVSGEPLPTRVFAQYRAHGDPVPATLDAGRTAVRFDEPQLAVAPGQTIAFYDGDEVLGGAIID